MSDRRAGNAGKWRRGLGPPGLWFLLGLLVCQFACVPLCSAQEPKKEDAPGSDSGPIMLASLGWAGLIPSDRWGPIWVSVTVGDRALAGTIVVEFPQDDTQTARISVPFAATPNKTTQVPIVAALPNSCDRVTFTMLDELGRVVRSLEYTRGASDRTVPLPPMVDSGAGLFVCVGRSGLPEAVKAWAGAVEPASGGRLGRGNKLGSRSSVDYAWTRAAAVQVSPEELSSSWMAYDGVLALVVHPMALGVSGPLPDPRAIEAIHTWVRSGGRLVVMADGPGESWRDWIPAEAREFVSLGAVSRGPLPRAVSDAVYRAMRAAAAPKLGETEPTTSPEPTLPGPGPDAPQRGATLSQGAVAAGWQLRWTVDGGPSLLAEGPVGYGHVVVLGLDPMRAPVEVSSKASGPVWKDALEPAVTDWLLRASGAQSQGYWTGTAQDRANNAAVERLGEVPAIGDGIFVVIAAAMLMVVALVGPGDFFLLRRLRSGHWSWLSAMVWIALASVVAFGAPRVLRTAPTQINRLSVVDKFVGPGSQAQSFETGMTGLYAGESGMAKTVGVQPTSWWRGRSVDYGGREFRGLAVVPTVQAAAGGEAGSTRGNPLSEVPLALWTFRAFADDALASPAWEGLTARVHREGSAYRVAVVGLPPGVIVSDAALRTGNQWYGLSARSAMQPEPRRPQYPRRAVTLSKPEPAPLVAVGEMSEGAWSGLFPDEFAAATAARSWSNPAPDSTQPYSYGWYSPQGVDERPGPMLDLPGADRRGQAVERYTAGEKYAAVYLNVVGCPAGVSLQWPARTTHTAVLRVVVPLGEGER